LGKETDVTRVVEDQRCVRVAERVDHEAAHVVGDRVGVADRLAEQARGACGDVCSGLLRQLPTPTECLHQTATRIRTPADAAPPPEPTGDRSEPAVELGQPLLGGSLCAAAAVAAFDCFHKAWPPSTTFAQPPTTDPAASRRTPGRTMADRRPPTCRDLGVRRPRRLPPKTGVVYTDPDAAVAQQYRQNMPVLFTEKDQAIMISTVDQPAASRPECIPPQPQQGHHGRPRLHQPTTYITKPGCRTGPSQMAWAPALRPLPVSVG
jgi:hypothetical protein